MFSFELQDDEQILSILRQTEVTLIKPAVFVMAAIYIPWSFLIRYNLHVQYRFWLLALTFAVLTYAVHWYVVWLLTSYILTNQRLVSIHYKNIFNKEVFDVPLDKVLTMSYRRAGVAQSLFNYGDIEVQSAGVTKALIFKNIHQPGAVKDNLWSLYMKSARAPVGRSVSKMHVVDLK